MLHILHGPDSFSRAEAVAALKKSLDTDGMLASNINTLEARSLNPAQLQMVCDAAPFLAANRLVIVQGLLSRLSGGGVRRSRRSKAAANLPEEWQALPDRVAHMPPSTTLVLEDGDLPAESPVLTALAEHGRVRNYPRLPARALEGWIAQRAKGRGVVLDGDALRLFAESVSQETGEDGQWHALWGVVNDLEKLSLYAGRRPVSVEDVRRLVPAAADTNVFAYVDAVVERRGDEALRRLSDLLFAGQPAPVLLTMLARGYRQLLQYADLAAAGSRPEEITRRLNLPRWQVDRLARQASRYRLPGLTAIYDRILQADRSVKRGQADETAALELLTAELAAVG
ncbi:MAG: DNA polymerase III subunit delta [Dehalococcoidia bacterium]